MVTHENSRVMEQCSSIQKQKQIFISTTHYKRLLVRDQSSFIARGVGGNYMVFREMGRVSDC